MLGPMRPDEEAFVAKATKKSLRGAPPYDKLANYEAYRRLNPEINEFLRVSRVIVARDPRNPTHAYGFAIYDVIPEALTVHFLYVAHDDRRDGIARTLLDTILVDVPDDADLEYTFPTARFKELATRYGFWCPNEEV